MGNMSAASRSIAKQALRAFSLHPLVLTQPTNKHRSFFGDLLEYVRHQPNILTNGRRAHCSKSTRFGTCRHVVYTLLHRASRHASAVQSLVRAASGRCRAPRSLSLQTISHPSRPRPGGEGWVLTGFSRSYRSFVG
jgi:hypothetical protein